MTATSEIPILLLGDAGVGKSTFLSRLTLGSSAAPHQALPTLRDLDQPFPFRIRLYGRHYDFEFSDTASPTNYTLLRPAVIILCYSIAAPDSLRALQTKWKTVVEAHFNYDEALPVVVLGLQRDVRTKQDYDGSVKKRESEQNREGYGQALDGPAIVYPQEGLRVAQEMRCDRYCECSALTGELCREVFEDIARTAAMTTTGKGGKSAGTNCTVI